MIKPLNRPIKTWSDKKVWIVGASSGIGAAFAADLLALGATVTLSARRLPELEAVANQRSNAHLVSFDVTDTQAWPQALQQVLEAMGGLDLVVLGAACYDPVQSCDFEQNDIALAVRSFDLNVVSVYRALSAVIPYFVGQGAGGVAMIGSISSYTGLPRAMIYGATKAALNNLAETLYFELAPKGVSVYLISPGFVKTPMTAKNDFEMPSLMQPAEAARAMRLGFESGKFEIRFPRVFGGLLRLISRLPYRLRFLILHKVTGM